MSGIPNSLDEFPRALGQRGYLTISDILKRHSSEVRLPVVNSNRSVPRVGLLHRSLSPSPSFKWIFAARIRHKSCNDLVLVSQASVQIRSISPGRSDIAGKTAFVGQKSDFRYKIRSAAILGSDYIAGEKTSFHDYVQDDDVMPPNMLVLALDNGSLVFLLADRTLRDGKLNFFESTVPILRNGQIFRRSGAHIAIDRKRGLLILGAYDCYLEMVKLKTWDTIAKEFATNHCDWCPILRASNALNRKTSKHRTLLAMAFLSPKNDTENDSLFVYLTSEGNRVRVTYWEGDLFQPANQMPIISDQALPACFMITCGPELYSLVIIAGQLEYAVLDGLMEHGQTLDHPETLLHTPRFISYTYCFRHPNTTKSQREEIHILREDGLVLRINDRRFSNEPGKGIMASPAAKFNCNGSSAFVVFLTTGSLTDVDSFAVLGDMSEGQSMSIGEWHEDPHRLEDEVVRGDAMKARTIQLFPNWSPTLDITTACLSGAIEASLLMTANRQPYGVICELAGGREAVVQLLIYMNEVEIPETATKIEVVEHLSGSNQTQELYFVSFVTHTEVILRGFHGDNDSFSLDCRTMAVAHEDNLILHVAPEMLTLWSPEGLSVGTSLAELRFSQTRQVIVSIALPYSTVVVVALQDYRKEDVVLVVYDCKASDSTYMLQQIGKEQVLNWTPTSLGLLHPSGPLGNQYIIAGGSDGSIRMYCVGTPGSNAVLGLTCINCVFAPRPAGSTPQGMAIDSIGIIGDSFLPYTVREGRYSIICGLRDGRLCLVDLEGDFSDIQSPIFIFKESRTFSLGTQPVDVQTDSRELHNVAVVTCGSTTVCIDFASGHVDIRRLTYTHPVSPGLKQPSGSVVRIIPTERQRGSTSLRFVTHCADGLMISVLENETGQVNTRQIPLSYVERVVGDEAEDIRHKSTTELQRVYDGGTPYKIIFSKRLNAMIVATTRLEMLYQTAPDPARDSLANKRVWRSVLHLIPAAVTSTCGISHDKAFFASAEDNTLLDFGIYEKITALCEWTWIVDSENTVLTKDVLLVATSTQTEGIQAGRLYFLPVQQDSQGHLTGSVEKIKILAKPILTMAVYDESRMVICDAEELFVYGLVQDESRHIKWVMLVRHRIHDQPRFLSVEGSIIYVSTASGSMIAFTYLDSRQQDGSRQHELVTFFSDEMARRTFTHLVIDVTHASLLGDRSLSACLNGQPKDTRFVLLATEEQTIAVLAQPNNPPTTSAQSNKSTSVRTLIQAHLTEPISCLTTGPIRPPWLQHLLHPPGILGPDIIGTSPSGRITHIRMLSPIATHVLKFLENLVYYTNQGQYARVTTNPIKNLRLNLTSDRTAMAGWLAQTIDPIPSIQNWDLKTYHTSKEGIYSKPIRGYQTAIADDPHHNPLNQSAINGDYLVRFTHADGAHVLLSMLTQTTWEAEAEAGSGNVEAAMDAKQTAKINGNDRTKRTERFVNLLMILLPARGNRPANETTNGSSSSSSTSIRQTTGAGAGADAVDVINEDDDDDDIFEMGDLMDTDTPEEIPIEVEQAVAKCVCWLKEIWQFL